jgi:hypothetical protein
MKMPTSDICRLAVLFIFAVMANYTLESPILVGDGPEWARPVLWLLVELVALGTR